MIITTGRRKTAAASFFMKEGKGDFTVNGLPIFTYFPSEKEKSKLLKPFFTVGISQPETQFSGSFRVKGSGKCGQLGAVVLAIARALATMSEDYAILLRKQGLSTRDPRMVERKKYYLHKARKAPQYSKR
jgi:small subunit ribosomal protein S9